MTQDRNTGAQANEFGKRMAIIVASHIGANKVNSDGNEFTWQDKKVTIRSAHKGNAYVGVLYSMLERVDAVLGALETDKPDEFQIWELDSRTYRARSKPQVKNPHIAQVPIKVFAKEGKLTAKVMDSK
jgi:hypothetical protein